MQQYETIIRIITNGNDAFDAGDKAGELIDVLKIQPDMDIICEPTHTFMQEKR